MGKSMANLGQILFRAQKPNAQRGRLDSGASVELWTRASSAPGKRKSDSELQYSEAKKSGHDGKNTQHFRKTRFAAVKMGLKPWDRVCNGRLTALSKHERSQTTCALDRIADVRANSHLKENKVAHLPWRLYSKVERPASIFLSWHIPATPSTAINQEKYSPRTPQRQSGSLPGAPCCGEIERWTSSSRSNSPAAAAPHHFFAAASVQTMVEMWFCMPPSPGVRARGVTDTNLSIQSKVLYSSALQAFVRFS